VLIHGCAANAVRKRYQKARSGATQSAAAFDSINSSASQKSVEAWSSEEKHAQLERVRDITVMDIYDIKAKRRELDHSALVEFSDARALVPSRAEILLDLTQKEVDNSGYKGHAAWLESGLKIQETQYDFGTFHSEVYNHCFLKSTD
jgi:hypothetical protein